MQILTRRSAVRAVFLGSAAAPFILRKAVAADHRIAVAYPNVTLQFAPLYVAATQGFFKDEGLTFTMVVGSGGSNARQVLATGEADFALADIAHALLLTARGRPAKVFSATDRRCGAIQMVIRKDLYENGIDSLEKVAQWKRPDGRKPIFGTFSLGGTSHIWASLIMNKMGIEDKVTWLGVGAADTVMGGLQSKQFDVITCTPAMQIAAEEKGWGALIMDGVSAEVADRWIGGEAPVTGNFALQSTVDRDPSKVQAYVNAMYRGARWLKDKTPEEILDAIKDYVGSSSSNAAIAELKVNRDVFDYSGFIGPEAFARGGAVWFRSLTDIAPIAYENAVDTTFIKRAQQQYG